MKPTVKHLIDILSVSKIKTCFMVLIFYCVSLNSFAVTYYNKASGTGALQTLSNWGVNTDGTGTAPSNFTTAGNIFNLYNGSTATISAAWVMSGGTLNIGNGSAAMNFTIPSSFSLTGGGTVSVSAGATLTLQNATNPTLGTLNATSMVDYNGTGSQTIAAATYGNLSISGARTLLSTITLVNSGTITVIGSFAATYTGTVLFNNSGNTFVYGATTGGQTVESAIQYNNLTLSNTSGTNTADGNLTVAGALTTTAGGTLDMATYTLSEAGTPVNNGTIKTQNTSSSPITTGKSWGGTVNYNAASGGQTIMAGTYATLTLAHTSGTSNASGAITVNTALNTTAGGTFAMGANALAGTLTTITNNGTISSTNTSTTPFTTGKTWGGSGTVNYASATGGQTVMTGTYNCGLTVGNSSGTSSASGTLTINGSLVTTSGGVLDMLSSVMNGTPTSVTNNGTIRTSSTTTPALPAGQNWGGTTGTVIFARSNGGQRPPGGTYKNLTFNNTSGTMTIQGVITVNGTLITTSAGSVAFGANQLLGTPTVTNNGSITTTSTANPAVPAGCNWSGTTGSVTFSSTTGGQFIPAGTYKRLTCSNTSGTNFAVGNLVVNTSITTSSTGGTLDLGTNTLSGTLTTFTNTGTLKTQNTSSTPIPSGKTVAGTVNYNAASGGQTIVPQTSYATLTLGNTSGTSTAGGLLTINTALNTTAGGTLDMTAAYRMAGTLTTITNNGTIISAVPTSVSALPFTTGKTWGGSGTVIYSAASGAQTIMAGTYNCNLTVGNSSGTSTASAAMVVNGTLTTTNGGLFAMSTFALSGTGAIVNNGTITTSCISNPCLPSGKNWSGTTGNVIFLSLTGLQYIPTGTYGTLKVSNTSGTDTATGNLTVNASLITTAGGTLVMKSNQLLGTMTATNNGAVTTTCTVNPAIPAGVNWSGSTGLVNFALLTGGQYVPAGTYKTLTLSNTSGTNAAVGDITLLGTLTVTAGGTLDMGTSSSLINSGGTINNNGTIKTSVPTSTSATPLPAGLSWTGVINYAAPTGGQTVMDGTYTNITLSNTSGINEASGDIVVNTGTMITTVGGTLDMGATAILSGSGTFTNNGNIQTSVPTTISATPIPSGRAWAGTITYGASAGSQTIVPETSYNNLTFLNTSGINTAAANVVANGILTTTAGSGIQDMASYTLSGSLTSIAGGGTISTENTTTAPIKVSQTWTQNINYANPSGGQTIVSGTYAGLTNSNTSGTNTIATAAAINVTGTLRLDTASLMANNGVSIGLAGSLLGAGTMTGTGTVNMTGSGATIDGVTLSNLNLNNAGGFSLIADLNITGTLTLSSGVLGLNTYNLILGATATAVGGTPSSAKMILADGGGKVIKYYTAAGSFLFPIGDNAGNYSPITLNFTSGSFGSGAYASVNVTDAKHPQNASTTNYITRYWAVNTSGITSPVYNVTATYSTSDVSGTEASISMGQYTGSLPWVKYGATNTSTHTLTATGLTSATSEFTGIASANPTASITPSSVAICNGGSVGLTVTGTGSPVLVYRWSPATGLSATTGSTIVAAPTAGTVAATYIYTVTLTDGNGFTATGTSTVTVNPTPVISGNTTVCVGLTSVLAGNLSGGTWTSSNTAKATVGSASGIVTGVSSGTAIITYTLPTGCFVATSITVNSVPAAITGTSNVCAGGTVALTETVPGGAWSSSDALTATVGTTGIVTGVTGGVATISYISGASCYATYTVTVGPIQPITGINTACVGLTTTLSNLTSGGTWSSSNTAIATIGSGSGVATGIATGSAIITYTIGSGCTRTIGITVNQVPAAITGTTSVCSGLTTTLSESVSGGTWSSSNISLATVGSSSGIVSGVSNGTVNISYVSGASCFVVASVTVNPLPAAITGSSNVCVGLAATLSDATSGGTWSISNSNASIGSGSGITTGVTAGNATITYTLPTGCVTTSGFTVNPLPASINGTTNVCVGLTRNLSNATSGGTWTSSNTGLAIIGSSTGVVGGVGAGALTITYTIPTGCISTAAFTVNAFPATITGTSVVCAGLTTTLSNTSGGGTWTSSNTALATIGSGSGIVTGVASGNPTITYTLATGCSGTKVITVNPAPAAITGTTNVCVTGNRTLTDATSGGTWTSSNTSLANIGSGTGIVTGVANGTLAITYTLPTGCIASTPITVNPLPAAIAGPTAVCNGSNITLTDATTGGTWRSVDVTNITIGSTSGIVSVITADTTTVFYTLPTGCASSIVITSNDVPLPIGGAIDTCVGLTISLTDATTGGIWSSSNTAIATVGSATGAATGVSAGTAIITYTLPTTGCYTTVGLPVDPMPSSITGTLNVCTGAVSNLDDLVTGGFFFSSNSSIASIDSISGDMTGVSSGTATITYILSTGCKTVSTATVNAMPTIAGATSNSPICAGTTLSLIASSPVNVTSYSWSGPVAITASTSSSASVPSATTAASGTYDVIISNGSGVGCTDSFTTTVTVNPTPVAAPTNSAPICRGGTVTLTANPSGGASTYSWSGAFLSSTTAQNPTATPTVTTTYSLTVTNGSGNPGCSPSTIYTTIVSLNPVPTAGPTNNGPICNGSTATLSANPAGGASTYAWSGAFLSSSTAQNPTVTPTVTTTYSLTVTNGSGASGCSPATTYTTTVTVNAVPSLTGVSNNGPICAGASLNLTASGPTNVTGYSWSGPVAITSSTSASASVPAATTAASGTYTVTVNNGTGIGCTRSYTTTATVNATPAAAPTNNAPICVGGTVSLSANPAGTSNAYTWSGIGLSSTTAQNPTATPTVTATYSLTVSYIGGLPGCAPSTIYTTTVSVNALPTAAPTNNGPGCSGNSITLFANPAGSANTYVWSGANLASTTAQNPTATPTVTTTYSLTVSYGTGHPGCSPVTVYTTSVSVYPIGRWSGAVDTNWGNNSNWCGNVPLVTTDILVPSGITNYPVITSGTYPVRNITILSGASAKVNGGTLEIAGAVTNSGTFNATNGTIAMIGSSSQTISASTFSTNTIKNLTINNSAGVTLGGALNISEVVKATTGNLNSGGYLTLLSTSAKTALIDGSGTGNVLGAVTMQRYLDSTFGYRIISSPFDTASVRQMYPYINMADTFPQFFSYKEDTVRTGWITDTLRTNVLSPMRGYGCNFGSSHGPSTYSLRGSVNNGTVNNTLYNHNYTYTLGFNCIGNPYPSPIDWHASTGWTKVNIDDAIYYYDNSDTNRYYGTYSSYVAGVSSNAHATGIIPAMQGFFVHVSSGSYPVTATLNVNNNARVNNLTPYYHKPTVQSVPLVRVSARFDSKGQPDPMVVCFRDGVNRQFNSQFDALKMLNTDDETPNLYSISDDKQSMSIYSLPINADSFCVVPLGLSIQQDGWVNFDCSDIEAIPAGMHAYFMDAKSGISQDATANPNYRVFLTQGKHEDRFFLCFKPEGASQDMLAGEMFNAYSDDSKVYVDLHVLSGGEGDITLFDLSGRVLHHEKVLGYGVHEMAAPQITGVYIVSFVTNGKATTKKIFINRK